MEMTPFLFGLYKLVKYVVYPLNWVLLLMTLTMLVSWLPQHPRRMRWLRIFATSSLILLLTICSPLVARQMLGSLEAWYAWPSLSKDDHYDAIVVLGGGVLQPGTLRPRVDLSSVSKNRTMCGVDLYQQGYANKLVFTGGTGHAFQDGPKDAPEMKRWAERLGIPAEAILTEERSRTTYENATETRGLLGPASILLVTSASHLPRATALFRKQGFRVMPAPCDVLTQHRPEDSLAQLDLFDILPNDHAIEQTTVAMTEWVGMAVYWMTGKL
jgi:uncharacterized SAM-binding protein YcdF (DUF218 family)